MRQRADHRGLRGERTSCFLRRDVSADTHSVQRPAVHMYEDKRLPDFEEMKEFAWEMRTKSAGAKAGFVLA